MALAPSGETQRRFLRMPCSLHHISHWMPAAAVALWLLTPPLARTAADDAIAAIGRLEPRDGIVEVSGPSGQSAVIARLDVKEGDRIEKGAVIAVLDVLALHAADVARITAELENAEREFVRAERLKKTGIGRDTDYDTAQLGVRVARAQLKRARVQLKLSEVRSPISGQVLLIHAHTGERVGPQGIVEIGRTDEMYAVAEVYETDIGRVKVDQKATISSPAFDGPLTGVVERVGLKVGKLDVLSTDPAARTDARVVEVRIRLDDSTPVSGLTNLQVNVEIAP